mmetsp:Transcript_90549/g.256449  ORF Transcript_90549/g.256449 Transcript_90549/m.256449 type:complete len:227 (-) Transcript_90549:853-1533(-)
MGYCRPAAEGNRQGLPQARPALCPAAVRVALSQGIPRCRPRCSNRLRRPSSALVPLHARRSTERRGSASALQLLPLQGASNEAIHEPLHGLCRNLALRPLIVGPTVRDIDQHELWQHRTSACRQAHHAPQLPRDVAGRIAYHEGDLGILLTGGLGLLYVLLRQWRHGRLCSVFRRSLCRLAKCNEHGRLVEQARAIGKVTHRLRVPGEVRTFRVLRDSGPAIFRDH